MTHSLNAPGPVSTLNVELSSERPVSSKFARSNSQRVYRYGRGGHPNHLAPLYKPPTPPGMNGGSRPPKTPDYAAQLRSQVEGLQGQLGKLLELSGGGGFGGKSGDGNGILGMPSLPVELGEDAEIKKLYAVGLYTS
jgi:hypothetical protein